MLKTNIQVCKQDVSVTTAHHYYSFLGIFKAANSSSALEVKVAYWPFIRDLATSLAISSVLCDHSAWIKPYINIFFRMMQTAPSGEKPLSHTQLVALFFHFQPTVYYHDYQIHCCVFSYLVINRSRGIFCIQFAEYQIQ